MTTPFHSKIDGESLCLPYCRIKSSHISEMYDRYESGICDQTTANAVAIALSKKLRIPVRVIRHGANYFAHLGGQKYLLPSSVGAWLNRVDRGLKVDPFNLHFQQPQEDLEKSKLAA